MIKKLIKETRSIRSFNDQKVSIDDLIEIINCVRYSSSTANIQNIRYKIVNDKDLCEQIFSITNWAGLIEWKPKIQEGPQAYIVLLRDKSISINDDNFFINAGIALQNLSLLIKSYNMSSCIVGSYNKIKFNDLISLDNTFESYFLIGIGYGKETIKIIESNDCKENKYYREGNIHIVPKISLKNILIK